MEKINKIKNAVSLSIVLLSTFINAQETVTFDVNQLAAGIIEPGFASLNSSYLLDSDIERPRNTSNEDRWAEMQLGSVRFPYGGLADNYLWDTPPYGGTLVPKTATLDAWPGAWSWATNPDRTLNEDMDFDEFMAICQRQNIKPLIVINALSWKHENGPDYSVLKTTAVEWVKYAKQKGYEVAYWQIGNEIDHHRDQITKSEYISLYVDFVSAMKAEDPTILCGTGILSDVNYFKDLMTSHANLVDFTSVHQYLFNSPFTDYNSWLNHNGSDVSSNVSNMQNAVNNSSKPNLPILVTETNAFGNWGESQAIFKSLAWFDMLFTQQKNEDVVYNYMWNSHSVWKGENGDGGIANALTNDTDNNITAMGMVLKILNTTAEERYMIPDNKIQGNIYSYGSFTPTTGDMTIYLINKSESTISMTVNVDNYNMFTDYEKWMLTGSSQYDSNPTFNQIGTISYTNDGFTTDLSPHSLSVVKLKGELVKLDQLTGMFYLNHKGSNRRLITNIDNSDAVTTVDSEYNTTDARWNFIDAGDGYVFIENIANNMRLNATSAEIQNESSINLVGPSNQDDAVKWKVIQIDDSYFIDNKGLDRRLNINNNKAALGLTSYDSSWMKWNLTSPTLSVFKNQLSGIQIYPNPVKSELTVQYNFTENSKVILTLYNIQGQVIKRFSHDIVQAKNQEFFDFTNVASGLYFVNIKVIPLNGKTPKEEIIKIIVQK